MTLDVFTLHVAVAIASWAGVLALLVVWPTSRQVPGFGYWALGTISGAASWPLMLQRGRLDNPLLVLVLPTFLVLFTVLTYYLGARRFTGKSVKRGMLIALTLPMISGYFIFFVLTDSMMWRARIITLWSVVLLALTAWTLIQEKRAGLQLSTKVMGIGFLLGACLTAFRLASWSVGSDPVNWLNGPEGGNVGLATGLIVLNYLWVFCLLILVNQHQAREVALRTASELATEQKLAEARTEIERERAMHLRQMMARELHDGIGGITATVAMLAGTSRSAGKEAKREALDLIEEMALEGNRNIRGLMDFLDSGVFLWRVMLREMEEYLKKLADATGVSLEWHVAGDPDLQVAPDGLAGNSLRMVVMEAAHNMVRHSGAKAGTVSFNFRGHELEVEIRDNGKGFSGERIGGKGIGNMRARMEELGGDFSIRGENGTTVKLRLPMARSGPCYAADDQLSV